MATLTQTVSAFTTFPNSTNLKNLSDNKAVPMGLVDSSGRPNGKLYLNLKLGSSCRPGGTIELYMMSCIEGAANSSNWTDGISPIASPSITTGINNMELIHSIKADKSWSTGRVVWVCNDLAAKVGKLPPYWTICVHNNSGSTLGTGHVTKYKLATYQSV